MHAAGWFSLSWPGEPVFSLGASLMLWPYFSDCLAKLSGAVLQCPAASLGPSLVLPLVAFVERLEKDIAQAKQRLAKAPNMQKQYADRSRRDHDFQV
jgi:hypothetical protein